MIIPLVTTRVFVLNHVVTIHTVMWFLISKFAAEQTSYSKFVFKVGRNVGSEQPLPGK